MTRQPTSKRRSIICGGIVAAALAAAASSQATTIPTRPYYPYYQKFTIRIAGTETTSWRAPQFYYYKTSYGLYWREGHGTEQIWFNTGLVQGFAFALSQREFPVFEFGSYQQDRNARVFLLAVGGIDRDGEISRGADPGPAGGGWSATNTGPYDCRYIRRDYTVQIDPRSNRTFAVSAATIRSTTRPFIDYKNCPASGGGRTVPGIFWPITQRLPVAKLFAGQRFTVHAHRRFITRPRGASNLTATTDVSWSLIVTPEELDATAFPLRGHPEEPRSTDGGKEWAGWRVLWGTYGYGHDHPNPARAARQDHRAGRGHAGRVSA